MYFEDSEETKDEWQKDLSSWKKRRQSASSAKHRIDDDGVTTSLEGGGDKNKSKSLRNRKWNKYLSMDDGDDEDDDDDDDGNNLHKNDEARSNHFNIRHSQSPSTAPITSTSSTWPQKDCESNVASSRKAGAREEDDIMNVCSAEDERKVFQEKVIKIKQRPNNPKGFGFEIGGGREEERPITIHKVARGSSSDICGLKTGDVVIFLNGVDISLHYRDSVARVIENAIENGTIELKIRRLKDDLDDALSDEDEDEELSLATPRVRWSGSQSSHRSTPPLPPQPDYFNDCFVESPPPLPFVPPPPVNWSTFPDSGESGENTPTLVSDQCTTSSSRQFNAESSQNPPPTNSVTTLNTKSLKESTYRRKIPSRDDGNSPLSHLSNTQNSSDHLKETLAVQKFKFLGLEPENSEELKLIKEKKTLHGQHLETTFPATGHGYESAYLNNNASDNNVAVQSNALTKESKNVDDTSFISCSSGERMRMVNNKQGPHFDFDKGNSSSSMNVKPIDQYLTEVKELESKGRKKVKDIQAAFNNKPANFDPKFGTNVVKMSHKQSRNNVKREMPPRDIVSTGKLRNGNIEKVETSKNAAEQWKQRDREMKEREEKEKKQMMERHDKFNKETSLPPFSSGIPSVAKTHNSNSFDYSYFTGNINGNNGPDPIQSNSTIQLSASVSPSAHADLGATEKFGLNKSQYKPIKLKLDKIETTVSIDRPFFMGCQENDIKNEFQKSFLENKQEGDKIKLKSRGTLENGFNNTSLSDSLKRQGSSFGQGNVTSSEKYEESHGHDGKYPSIASAKVRSLEESDSLRKSLREEEIELLRVREQQEVEKIKLERVKEEKKVEELKMMRMKEEEEVQRMKEMRMKEQKMKEQRMMESHGSGMSDREHIESIGNSKHCGDVYSQILFKNEGLTANGVPPKDSDAKSVYPFPRPFQTSDKQGPHIAKRIEENSYENSSRAAPLETITHHDKTSVKTVVLNKPNFFGVGSNKNQSINQIGDGGLSGRESDKVSTSHLNFNHSPTTRIPSYEDYANPSPKSPSCFGPTFKRINDDIESGGSDFQYQHTRSLSTSDSVKSEPHFGHRSNISYLLYGENHPKEATSPTGNENLVAKDVRTKKVFNVQSPESVNPPDSYKTAKNLSKHWFVEEAERRRKADRDGLQMSSWIDNDRKNATATSEPFSSSLHMRSKSGNYQDEPRKVVLEKNKPTLQTSFQHQKPTHARRLSSSYTFDSTHPGTFSYANFAQPPNHHSASVDYSMKSTITRKESPSAADRLFPGGSSSRISSPGGPKSSFENPVTAINHSYLNRSQHPSSNSHYTSSSAIDSLFAHNDTHKLNHKEPPRATPQPSSQFFNKKISASSINLAHGNCDDSFTTARGWSAKGSRVDQTNNQGGYSAQPNFKKTAAQYHRHGVSDY